MVQAGRSHSQYTLLISSPCTAAMQELQGRVAGRNSEDAAQIKAGLIDLQAQWKSYEQSAKQVRGAMHG